MLRCASYDIVFQEVPGEVTLALNLSGCLNRCEGCHSPHLREDIGEALDEESLAVLLERYGGSVTCVCFMGGDGDPSEVARLASLVRSASDGHLKTAWYSGRQELPPDFPADNFNYIKLGPYIGQLGGLSSKTTNQRFYRVDNMALTDVTELFWR